MSLVPTGERDRVELMQQQVLLYAEELRELYRIERARAEELEVSKNVLERRKSELEALHAIDLSILGVVPFDETLAIATDGMSRLLAAERVLILRYESGASLIRPAPGLSAAPFDDLGERLIEGDPLHAAISTATPAVAVLQPVAGWQGSLYRDGLRSVLVVPLVTEGLVIGALVVASARPEPHQEDEVSTARRIGAQVAVALRAGELAAVERRRTVQLEAIRRISEAVGSSLELAEVIEAALESSLAATGLDAGVVMLPDDVTGDVVLAGDRNVPDVVKAAIARMPSDSPMARDFMIDRPRVVRDVSLHYGEGELDDAEGGPRPQASIVGAPLVWEGRTIGALILGSRTGIEVSEDDIALVAAIARPVAAAVGNARLHQSLRASLELLRQTDKQRGSLLTRLVNAQEEERGRIAADIHDDPIQLMTAVGMRLQIVSSRLEDPALRKLLEPLEENVGMAIGRLRTLMFELRPPALDREGLVATLRQYLDQVTSETGLRSSVETSLTREAPPETRVIMYRIAQEALANVRKHSGARTVRVRLEEQEGGIFMEISDDGRGLPPGQGSDSPRGHLGLTAMRERAEMAGGWWRIESSEGGTKVTFWLPAHHMETAA